MSEAVDIVRVAPGPSVRTWCDRHGFSPELVARWVEFLPEPKEVLASLLRPVPLYLRVNTLRTDADRLQRKLEARGFTLSPVDAPDPRLSVLRIEKSPFAVSSTPEYLSGDAYLQDLASLTAPAALEPKEGERILDMAAAPGGKTTAIAELVGDQASILAVEPVPARAAALTANLRRLQVAGAAVTVRRAEAIPEDQLFDRILLDAPCTGEGVLPRDARRRTGSLDEHEMLARLQRTLVEKAATLLAPGGTFVYSTCTFAPEECEAIVTYAASLGLEPEPIPFDRLNGVALAPPLEAAGPLRFGPQAHAARRVYPHRHQTLGFFVARFRRPDGEGIPVHGAAAAKAEGVEVRA